MVAGSSYQFVICFFFQAEDGIRDLVRSRGLGDVYKRQGKIFFKNLPSHKNTHSSSTVNDKTSVLLTTTGGILSLIHI